MSLDVRNNIYKLYFAMTAENYETHTVKGKEKKRERRKKTRTTYNSEHTNYELKPKPARRANLCNVIFCQQSL